MKSIYETTEERPNVFFIDGPGGTGKTFVYNLILARVRSKKHIALALASSGIGTYIISMFYNFLLIIV